MNYSVICSLLVILISLLSAACTTSVNDVKAIFTKSKSNTTNEAANPGVWTKPAPVYPSKSAEPQLPPKVSVLVDTAAHVKKYNQLKKKIASYQDNTQVRWRKASTANKKKIAQEVSDSLLQLITQRLMPPWYGTPWEFDGISQQPRTDYIACGYFVSTIMRDAGFKVQRIKLAQQASSNIVKTLCNNYHSRTYNKLPDLLKYLQQQPNGLFVVGLDYHVGFIAKLPEGLYFVHANPYPPRMAMEEPLTESAILTKSKVFVVGNILGHPDLINAWLQDRKVKTVY